MSKNVKKQVWMSPEEAADLADKARRCGMSEAALVRMLLSGFEPKEMPGPESYQAMGQLTAVGNNLNQLAVRAYSLDFIDTPMLIREIDKLNQFYLMIERKFLLPEESKLWQ